MGLVTLTFDLETGMRVVSKVGNLHSKFGHTRPSGSRTIRYVHDGRTDGHTDGQKQCLLPFPYRGILKINDLKHYSKLAYCVLSEYKHKLYNTWSTKTLLFNTRAWT